MRSIVCDKYMYVCLLVCRYLKTTRPIFTKFLKACCLWPWLGHLPTALRYVKYFRYCIVFLYHGANGPESSTTLYVEGVRQVAVPVGRQITRLWSSSPGAKSAIYDCLVRSVGFCS